jgi:DNA ligase (NAD+)
MNSIEQLKHYDLLYFNEGTSPITDTEYDKLKSKAKKEYPNDPYFKEVGAPITLKFEEIELPFIMGGLDEVGIETVIPWLKKSNDSVIASEKLDGNSIGCTWLNGKLIFAASRGDGKIGQNILNKAKYFVPNIPFKEKVSLRGEVLLEGEIFRDLGFKKNRRNAVTGLLRRDEIKPDDLKKLSVIFYEVVEAPIYLNLNNEVDRLSFILINLNLRIPANRLFSPNIENISFHLADYLSYLKLDSTYDIDGLVLTRNNTIRENTMTPKNKVKFKVNQEAVTCKVIDIEWNVTRTGLIKPVILIEPTEIMGVTVSRASGFNVEFIINNGIGIDSIIGVVRAGDVVPYVSEVYEMSNVIIPDTCPTCKEKTSRIGKELICSNNLCDYKNIYKTSHFFTSLGVENMSDKTIENIGIVNIPMLYGLTKKDLEKLPGFGEKKAEIVINEIKKTLTTKPEKLLAAFGIPMIGRSLSKQLCSKFTIEQLFEIKDPEVLGLGPITSKVLIDNIGNVKPLYDFLKRKGLKFEEEDMTTKNLKGLTFALTGEGPMKRSEIQKLIEGRGGEVKGINKETSYLVTNDTESTSGKMKSAVKYGTRIISYVDLMENFLN